MTEDQNKRLEQLTTYLVDRCISEAEYCEYLELSELLLMDMKHIRETKKVLDSY